MTALEKILVVVMLAMLALVGGTYWTGSEAPATKQRSIDSGAPNPDVVGERSAGAERPAAIERSFQREDRLAARSDTVTFGAETRTSAPARRDREGSRQNRYDAGAPAARYDAGARAARSPRRSRRDRDNAGNRSDREPTRRGSDQRMARTRGPAERGLGAGAVETTEPPEQDAIDSADEFGIADVDPEPRAQASTGGGPEDYFCALAQSVQENCRALPRDETAYEDCLSFGGYYTHSRHCGYQP